MSIKLGAALVTRSLHLNHNILSVLLFPSHLLHVLPHIHTLCKYSIFKFVYRHTSSPFFFSRSNQMNDFEKQRHGFMKDNISNIFNGFQKGHNAQH